MVLFYTKNIEDNIAYFSNEEVRHMFASLRKSVGDEIHFLDGEGNVYHGSILSIDKKEASVSIQSFEKKKRKRLYKSHIAIAPTKKADKIEWFVEKAIEIGVDEISFIKTAHSERKHLKLDRIHKIAISGMKQSMSYYLPTINEMVEFSAFIEKAAEHQRFIAAVDDSNQHLQELVQDHSDVCVLIGPEGGFRQNEIDLAKQKGFEVVSLGDRRLRTETAGIITANYLHDVMKIKNE